MLHRVEPGRPARAVVVADSGEDSVRHTCLAEIRSPQIGAGQICCTEAHVGQVGRTQVRASEDCVVQVSMCETGALKLSGFEDGVPQASVR